MTCCNCTRSPTTGEDLPPAPAGWPIDRLIPYARNARTHCAEQVAQIAASIREFGFTVPVLVNEQGTLIAGHGRVLAAHQLDITDVPTMVARGWTQAQIQAYRLTGKSHLAAALGFALVENGWRVLFTRTTDLVQRLQIARRELALEAAIAKLDKFHLLILDDIAYVTKDQAETSVLFELISARYERRSLLITANQPFGEWGKIFPDQAMTVAVVDRLVHHATIFEMNVESYRRRAALERKRGRGRPPAHATITANA